MKGTRRLFICNIVLGILELCKSSSSNAVGLCTYLDSNVFVYESGSYSIDSSSEADVSGMDAGLVQPDNVTMKCHNGIHNCFSLWYHNTTTSETTLLKQGCWIHSDNMECSNEVCNTAAGSAKDLRFCCCMGNFCNKNITDNYVPLPPTPEPTNSKQSPVNMVDEYYRERTIAIAIIPIILVAIIVVLFYAVYRICWHSHKEPSDSIHLMESSSSPCWELDSLKLNTIINGGKYGEVWQGTLGDSDVAIKVFTGNSQRQYYFNEKDIYMLPHMDHYTLPRFLGAEERVNIEGQAQYLLVMEYVTLGTLTNYLKHNKVDWVTMCKMCKSIAAGTAYLHSEIIRSDKVKPAIAHRDLNTRNILVRPSLMCVLCDFGFAMQINGSNYMKNGNQEVAEHNSLSDVGTIRYMPPEVLEGAVNLRDCEASLKQIDVYALGLVFWEIATRCPDLYQGLPVPDYQLPFQAELGPHPSFDDMQVMVSKNKGRPLFPDVWKDTNAAIRALKETIEDCWDQDGEARLTALCVEERVHEIENLWSVRYKTTPTINTTNFQSAVLPVPEKRLDLCNTAIVGENEIAPNHTLDRTVQECNARNLENLLLGGETNRVLSINIPSHQSRHSVSDNSVSTATTDTILSPLESIRPPPNMQQPPSWNMYCSRPKVLQPHQGKNPIVERNTHKRSDEDLEVQGNTLINRAMVHTPSSPGNQTSLEFPLVNEDTPEQGSAAREQPQYVRTAPRIPFTQNDVASEPLIVRPKQPNVQQCSKNAESKSFLEKLLRGPRLSLSFKKKDPVKILQSNPAMDQQLKPTSQYVATSTQSARPSNLAKAAISGNVDHLSSVGLLEGERSCPTEVRMEGGQAVVRPTDLPLNGGNNRGYNTFSEESSEEDTDPKQRIASSNINRQQPLEVVVPNDSKHQNFHRLNGVDKTHKKLLNDRISLGEKNVSCEMINDPDHPYGKTAARRPSSLIVSRESGGEGQQRADLGGYSNLTNGVRPVSSPNVCELSSTGKIC